ncbi:hypothetical protein MOQ72_38265, partial [Saccharopolyspora sp. K220]|uniref:hypothetical protein n=1 Tax=Saccharopolyspora soli TaxID=2926618 RepID=UPI001F58FD8E
MVDDVACLIVESLDRGAEDVHVDQRLEREVQLGRHFQHFGEMEPTVAGWLGVGGGDGVEFGDGVGGEGEGG